MKGRFAIPELPEVETVRRELLPWLRGRCIISVSLLDAKPGPKYDNILRAVGQCIEGVTRRGKFLLLPLSGGDELVIHLGMTGVLTPKKPERHARVHVQLAHRPEGKDEPDDLYFQDMRRFGRFLVVVAQDYTSLPTLKTMGPEPLSEGFTEAQLKKALERANTPIKPFLLSQKPVAGLGNIYADEVLWHAKIHPHTPAKAISAQQVAEMHSAIISVLKQSIEMQGTTLKDYRTVGGETGAYSTSLYVYGRDNRPCKRCDTLLKKITLGQRGTHFCPTCQQ